jgi:hypothetical protein
VGCAPNNHQESSRAAGPDTQAILTANEVDTRVLGLADTSMTRVAAPYNQIVATAKTPEVRSWALQTRVGQALATVSNATGPVPSANLLNLVVQISLQTRSLDEYWVPFLLHADGLDLLAAYKQSEADAWALVAQTFTAQQIADLKDLLAKWKKQNAASSSTGFVKFADTFGRPTAANNALTLPSSLLAILNVNPLAGLDPVTQEAARYRMLTERIVYIALRSPIIMQWQVEAATDTVVRTPDIQRALSTSEKYATIVDRFNDIAAKYPGMYSQATKTAIDQFNAAATQQRQAVIQEMNAAVTQQRQAIFQEVDSKTNQVHAILGDVRNSIIVARDAASSVNSNAAQTVVTATDSSKRILNQATICGIIVIVVGCLCPAIVIFSYRCASRRWLRRTSEEPIGSGAGRI